MFHFQLKLYIPIKNNNDIAIQSISIYLQQSQNSWSARSITETTVLLSSANLDESEDPTIPGDATAPIATNTTPSVSTIQTTEILPHPPTTENTSEDAEWRIISFVFIALTIILFVITIALYIVLPKPKKYVCHEADSHCQKVYSIPRANIVF